MKKFKVGETCYCSGLYGFDYSVEIVSRSDKKVVYKYTDDYKLNVAEIILQGDVESIVAWEYHSQYAPPGEYDYGYFFAQYEEDGTGPVLTVRTEEKIDG